MNVSETHKALLHEQNILFFFLSFYEVFDWFDFVFTNSYENHLHFGIISVKNDWLDVIHNILLRKKKKIRSNKSQICIFMNVLKMKWTCDDLIKEWIAMEYKSKWCGFVKLAHYTKKRERKKESTMCFFFLFYALE